jgi:hypothetical protein
MPKIRTTTAVILAPFAAGLILVAATESSLARVSTGARPTSAGKAFGVNAGVGKGVGADGGVAMGGSSGVIVPKPPRIHHPFPPRD